MVGGGGGGNCNHNGFAKCSLAIISMIHAALYRLTTDRTYRQKPGVADPDPDPGILIGFGSGFERALNTQKLTFLSNLYCQGYNEVVHQK